MGISHITFDIYPIISQGIRPAQDAARDEGAGVELPARRAVGGRRLGGAARVLGIAGHPGVALQRQPLQGLHCHQ